MKKSIRVIPVCFAVTSLLLASLACSLPSAGGDSSQPSKNGETSSGDGSDLDMLRAVVDPSELDSYQSTMVIDTVDVDGNLLDRMTMTSAWNKEQQASTLKILDKDENVLLEQITIGSTMWMRNPMMGDSWISLPATEDETLTGEVPAQELDLDTSLEDANTEVSYLGSETMNGVRCRHYRLEVSTATTITDPSTSSEVPYNTHSISELWIADEAGLPAVMVREISEMETTTGTNPTQYSNITIDYTDINGEVVIEPPV